MSAPQNDDCSIPLRALYVFTPGAVFLAYGFTGAEALWVKVKIRKPVTCAVTGVAIPAKAEAYRPLGNMAWRSHRICTEAVDRAVEALNASPTAGDE